MWDLKQLVPWGLLGLEGPNDLVCPGQRGFWGWGLSVLANGDELVTLSGLKPEQLNTHQTTR